MAYKQTGEKTIQSSLLGNKPYQKLAVKALPILVRQAQAEQTIYYSELADELGIINPRNLNYVLGTIGNSLEELGEKWDEDIPPLQCVVINKKHKIPGAGIAWFVENPDKFRKGSKKNQRELILEMLNDVFSYKRWGNVLKYFNLEIVPPVPKHLKISLTKRDKKGVSESRYHKFFKKFIYNNPKKLGIKDKIISKELEYMLPTGDEIDVVFITQTNVIGVEVKSRISDNKDIARGIYQCIKYQALLEAVQQTEGNGINCNTLLATEKDFPTDLKALKNTLKVNVLGNIH